MLSSAVVTLGPLCRIEGTLPDHAMRMARAAGAFQHGEETLCRRRDWERVLGALKAAGVAVRVDGEGPAGKAVLSLGNGGTGRIDGVLPRKVPKTWLARIQGRSLSYITPYALEEARQALLDDRIEVEVKPEYRKAAMAMDDLAADVMAALTMPESELPDVRLLTSELRPYQRRALAFGDACKGRFYIADEPGVGKTLSALGYALHRACQRVLVICPGSLKGQWRDEIREFVGGEVFIAQGRSTETVPKSTKWLITNPEILADRYDDFTRFDPEYVIHDEGHTFKSPDADRVKALFALATKAPFYTPLTGTPIENAPIDAWVQLNTVQPNWWGSRYDFGVAHCGPKRNHWASERAGRLIYDFKGVTEENRPILQERLRYVVLRRRLAEVGLQMPEQTRTLVRVELDKGAREGYEEVLAEYKALIQEITRTATDKKDLESALQKNRAQRAKLAMRLRRASSMGRIPDTVDMVRSIVESGERIVVYAYFRETVEALHKGMKKAKLTTDLIYGGDQGRREDVITAFKAGKLDVLVSSIEVGGVGLNFQKVCCKTLTHELSFKPIHIEQSEKRVLRSGQEKPVQNIYVLGENTVDERVLNVNLRKMAAIGAFLGGEEADSEEEILRDLEASFFDQERTL